MSKRRLIIEYYPVKIQINPNENPCTIDNGLSKYF